MLHARRTTQKASQVQASTDAAVRVNEGEICQLRQGELQSGVVASRQTQDAQIRERRALGLRRKAGLRARIELRAAKQANLFEPRQRSQHCGDVAGRNARVHHANQHAKPQQLRQELRQELRGQRASRNAELCQR
jgi:hypothetical protein